jgi:hypothetical protein
MSDKYEDFFSLAGKYIIPLGKILGVTVDDVKANELGHAIVGILDEGYEVARRDGDSVASLVDNELYRKGRICVIDGIEFYHQSSKYVRVVEMGSEFDFNLTNLPDYKALEEFQNAINLFIHDIDVQKGIEHNKSLAKASHLLSQYSEKLYWRKVASSLNSYLVSAKRDNKARAALATAGFSDDEIEGYIPSPHLNE